MSASGEILNKEDYGIGYDGPDADVMIVTIPLRKWAMNKDYGDVLVSGVFVKAERVALRNLQEMRAREAQKGIIKGPNGMGVA